MRHPLRKAGLWFAVALLGAAIVFAVVNAHAVLGEIAAPIIGGLGGLCIPVGVVYGAMSLLSALGEARLRRGIGVIARWQVSPAEWEAFRRFDTRRAGEPGARANDFKPRPAEGRAVEVIFGRHQVIVDGSYHPLRRWGLPELRGIGWLLPPDAAECIEFDIAYPLKSGGAVPMALRIPVPRAARDDGVRVFHHFKAKIPAARVGIAFRRPWLVIGWSFGVSTAAALVAGIGFLMQMAGEESPAATLLLVGGLIAASAAWFFTVIVLVATRPWKKRGG